ncbi:AAA family ATPase [Streptomyces sp. NPDC051578]|uniref:AAA family ATPase n=1 Tax=Streptomyces sp. NPDC051578 TaxID=3365662 RepID=UPI0037BB66B5
MLLGALALLTGCCFSDGGLPSNLSPISRELASGMEAQWSTSREPESRLFVSYLGTSPEGPDALLEGMDGPNRLFLLDEPEAGLQPEASRLQVQWMYERVAQGCQFMITTHSMTLASLPRARTVASARADPCRRRCVPSSVVVLAAEGLPRGCGRRLQVVPW